MTPACLRAALVPAAPRRALPTPAALRSCLSGLSVLLLLALPVQGAIAQRAADLPPTVGARVVATVIAWPDELPVPGALVTVDALGLTAMSGRDGRVVMPALPAGTHTLRVRQIGFRPATLTVRVLALAEPPGPMGVGYQLRLTRIPVILQTVAVRTGGDACRRRGYGTASADPRVVPVLEQLAANADRWRELAAQWPVEYTVARTRHFRTETGAMFAQHADTVRRRSDVRRPYRPGYVLDRKFATGRAVVEQEMHVPSFGDVAGEEFQQWHCFRYAGLERLEGHLLHRIDFTPMPDLLTPDVEGSLYVGAHDFLLRRSVFRLTRIPPHLRVRTVEAITTYRDLYAAVLVPEALTTTEAVRGIKVGGARVQEYLQRDALVAHRWVREPPMADSLVRVAPAVAPARIAPKAAKAATSRVPARRPGARATTRPDVRPSGRKPGPTLTRPRPVNPAS